MPLGLQACDAKLRRGLFHAKELTDDMLIACTRLIPVPESDDPQIDEGLLLDWGVRIGDVAHNLRCALDYLAWALVLLNGRTPDKNTSFPIFTKDTPGTLNGITKGMAEIYRQRIEGFQPYKSPDPKCDPLHVLNELSIIDKHRHLLIVTMNSTVKGEYIELDIVFGSDGPAPRKSVRRTLGSIGMRVTEIVHSFVADFALLRASPE